MPDYNKKILFNQAGKVKIVGLSVNIFLFIQ